MLEAKESEAKLVVGKLEPPWLENTHFFSSTCFPVSPISSSSSVLFPSRFLYPQPVLAPVHSHLVCLLLLIFLSLSFLSSPFHFLLVEIPLTLSVTVCCLFFLHLRWPLDLLNSCVISFHFPSSYSHTHLSLPLCLSDVFLILTLRLS